MNEDTKLSDFSPPAFHNKRICLTGGTDGIGLKLAQMLVQAGGEVLVIGRRKPSEITLPKGCHYCQCDLSKAKCSEKIIKNIQKLSWDTLDHLVHNAAIGYVGNVNGQTSDTIEVMIEANLKTPLALSHALFPLLAKREGSVCFIGSTIKGRAAPKFATYAATKTGLSDLARNLRTEWRGRVNVQEVNPGPTRTNFHAKSGLENPPLVSLFMTAEEVAKGIFESLKSGQQVKNFTFDALLFHAFKRLLRGAAA